MQTGYVLEPIALEVDPISLLQRQTYGHNHKSDHFQDQKPNLSQICHRADSDPLFAINFIRISIYA